MIIKHDYIDLYCWKTTRIKHDFIPGKKQDLMNVNTDLLEPKNKIPHTKQAA